MNSTVLLESFDPYTLFFPILAVIENEQKYTFKSVRFY